MEATPLMWKQLQVSSFLRYVLLTREHTKGTRLLPMIRSKSEESTILDAIVDVLIKGYPLSFSFFFLPFCFVSKKQKTKKKKNGQRERTR